MSSCLLVQGEVGQDLATTSLQVPVQGKVEQDPATISLQVPAVKQ
jgi:hypothetical protein